MPVSPSCVSGISVSHFRNCRSFDELWIFRVGPATLKDLTGRKSETQALPPRCRHAHSFRILSWNSASRPPLFLPPYCCTSSCKYLTLWKFQSIALEPEILWKRWFARAFRQHFSFVMPFSSWPNWLSVGSFLPAITFMWNDRQIPGWPQILAAAVFSLCALPGWFQLRDYFSKFPFRFSVC